MRVYLDNCSYNRPYDDHSQMRIHLDTQAKLHIQDMIRQEKIELVTSYVLDFENSYNRSIHAYHVPCAVIAECNYFVTTDDRLLKY